MSRFTSPAEPPERSRRRLAGAGTQRPGTPAGRNGLAGADLPWPSPAACSLWVPRTRGRRSGEGRVPLRSKRKSRFFEVLVGHGPARGGPRGAVIQVARPECSSGSSSRATHPQSRLPNQRRALQLPGRAGAAAAHGRPGRARRRRSDVHASRGARRVRRTRAGPHPRTRSSCPPAATTSSSPSVGPGCIVHPAWAGPRSRSWSSPSWAPGHLRRPAGSTCRPTPATAW